MKNDIMSRQISDKIDMVQQNLQIYYSSFFFNLGCRAEKLVIDTQGNQLYVAAHAIAK